MGATSMLRLSMLIATLTALFWITQQKNSQEAHTLFRRPELNRVFNAAQCDPHD